MRTRAAPLVAVWLCLVLALAACGGGDDQDELPVARLDRSGLDHQDVVTSICRNWELGHPDHFTINAYVWDLLRPLELVNSGKPPPYTNEQIDTAVDEACQAQGDDPDRFVAQVMGRLGLTTETLDMRLQDACRRYQEQVDEAAAGNGTQVLSTFIRDLAAEIGVDVPGLHRAIARVCEEG